jgi:hypothetical protein
MIKIKKTFVVIALLLPFTVIHYFEKPGLAKTSLEKETGATIKGRVTSVYGPVANARIRVAGTEKYVLTDRQGQYVLQATHIPIQGMKITAGKEGWFNNGQLVVHAGRTRDIFVNPIYLNDRPDYRFISPVICSRCHTKLTRYWDQSKMAHTTSNPKVLNMYYGTDKFQRQNIGPGYRLDNPKSNGNCATCHAPSATASSSWSQDLNSVLRSPETEWDGISCDYCHKVKKVVPDKTKPSGMAPLFERQSSSRGNSILIFGPYDDVVVPPMAASYSPEFDKGRFCSMCHGHFKQLEKGRTWDYNKVYSAAEWKGFGYVVDGGARNMWGTYRSPKNIRPHHFDGGTEIQLKTALSMELEGEITGNRLSINVYITNTNGGHWVPTGETMRSVMLLLKVVDSNEKPLIMIKGSLLPEWAGKGKVETGNYAGLPGQVFARVLADDDGNIHVPFWRATKIVADTRIRPKTTLNLKYEFVLDDPEDEPVAEAKLIYRPVIRQLAEEKNWTVKDIVITSSAW